MKNFILISFLAFFTQSINAAVLQVDNNSVNPGVFTNIQTAIDSAIVGDTIMVKGSPTNYSDITITKSLSLIGEGFTPITQVPVIGLIIIRTSNTYISGFQASILLEPQNSVGQIISNLKVERCRITGFGFGGCPSCQVQDIGICNNIFKPVAIMNQGGTLLVDTIIFENNIFNTSNFMGWNGASGMNTMIVRNNLFHSYYPATPQNATLFCFPWSGCGFQNAIVYNNIFYNTNPDNCVNCTFYNNLTYLCTNNLLPGNNATNITANPLFVNYAGGDFDFSHDYALQASSPCISAGAGGTDIGITGGLHPFTPGVGPKIPVVDSLDLSQYATPQGSSFFLEFKAKTRK